MTIELIGRRLFLSVISLVALSMHAADMTYGSPVGGVTITAPADSDRIISVPFVRKANWSGVVGTISGTDITVAGAPNWTTNAFSSSGYHYARMLTGAQKGHYFSIISNTATTLTVDAAGLNLSLISGGGIAWRSRLIGHLAPYFLPVMQAPPL